MIDFESKSEFLPWFVEHALHEDIADGDHTSLATIDSSSQSEAYLLVKADGVLAGMELAAYIFKEAKGDFQFKPLLKDGDVIQKGELAFTLSGPTRELLGLERLVLNVMQRMSGIATMSHKFAKAVQNYPVKILDTRKTTPLIRFLEKWAVNIGGCTNYRFGLYDRIMIKDNHITACNGDVALAISKVQNYLSVKNKTLPITLEVRNMKELRTALLTGGIDRIMLDNFNNRNLTRAVKLVNKRFETEASGGITFRRLESVARTGVDYISSGALTHSYKSLDLSLKIKY